MSKAQHTPEVLRSSFDIDGVRVELLLDEQKRRFTIATRWVNLVHIPIEFQSERVKSLAHEQASAVFETVCMDGATRETARIAKHAAMTVLPTKCINLAVYEREVMRRSAISKAKGE